MSGRERLQPLLDHGVIDGVLRPLLSGKEAEVWLVEAAGEQRVAKLYKDATHRSFKHRAEYTEGRQVRRSRDRRAMSRGSRYGKAQAEEAWKNAEVEAIYKLDAAGVRVPKPYDFVDGILVMELIAGEDGGPAPRLADVNLRPREAERMFHQVLREVVKMLCAGLVHGDLSDFNVLMSGDGPVIIDFPQAVDAAANQNAQRMLLRDVKNLTRFFGRWAKRLRHTKYGPEMWDLYERGQLTPDVELTGDFDPGNKDADVDAIIAEIRAAEEAERKRREALGLPPPRPARAPQQVKGPKPKRLDRPKAGNTAGGGDGDGGGGGKKKRRRRRRKKKGRSSQGGEGGQHATPRREPPRDGGGPGDRGGGGTIDLDDLDALLSED